VLGVLLSLWATRALSAFRIPAPIPLDISLTVDWRVLVYTFALSVGAGLFFGIAPAWAASRPKLTNALKGEDPLARPGSRLTLRNLLIVGQVAMCVILLTATGLFLRSLQQAATIDIGFRANGIVSLSVDPRINGYSAERTVQLLADIRRRVAALPGVISVVTTDSVPLNGGNRSDDFHALVKPKSSAGVSEPNPVVELYMVTPGYFETMGIPRLAGRDFSNETVTSGPKAAIIDEAFAKKIFGSDNPIGQSVFGGGVTYQIIGVVGNIKDTLQALLPRITQRTSSSFRDNYVQKHQKALKAQSARATPGKHGLIYGQYLSSIINRKAAEDALFAADDGTCGVWMLRVIAANGKRRMFASLLHGTMASGLGTAIGLQTSQPGRQVVCVAGDGGLTMLLGDLITIVSEKLPIKIAVYDNGKLGFVELEQKSEGLLPAYTDLKNPDFGKVAQAMGLWGRTVTDAGELESAVDEWLAVSGPALLNVKVAPMELVMPPFIAAEAAYGMAMYSVRAVLHGQAGDVFEMITENFPK